MMHKITWIGLMLLLSVVVVASPKIESWKTSNGAQVMYVHAPELPMFDVRVVFDAGSVRDGSKAGLAKVTNALISEAAGDWTAHELAQRMESVGAQYGNGSLKDMAWLEARSLSEGDFRPIVLSSLQAMLSAPAFKQEDFDRIKNTLKVAIKQSEQSAGSVTSKAFWELMYGEHPYAHESTGTLESLDAITRQDVVGFYRRFYVASNAIVAIVGDLDRRQAEAMAEQLVGKLNIGEKAPPIPAVPMLESAKTVDIDFPSSQTHLRLGQPGMNRQDKDFFPLYVGNHILGGSGLVSLMTLEVREARGLAYSAYTYFSPMKARGPFTAGASTKNDQAEEALKVMKQTINDFIQNGPTEQQLTNAKANIIGGYPLRIASNKKIIEYLALIAFYDYPLDYLDTFTKKVDAISVKQIQETFKRRLDPEHFVTVRVGKLNAKAK